jgi:hypothetical protein
MDVRTGRLDLDFGDIMSPGMSTAFLATDIAHDGYHVRQYQLHPKNFNTPETAPRLQPIS